jgi:hypothetical protein
MVMQNFRLPVKLFSGVLSLELLLTAVLPTQVHAQFANASSGKTPSSHSALQVTFDPPKDGQPDDSAGGASRDSGICPQDAKAVGSPVTPLMPANRHGLTVEDHPTFFVYVPQTSAQKALFVLKDKNEDYYYNKTLSLPRTAGIISFTLPTDARAIEIGKRYQWSFVMICGEEIRPDSPGVKGQIQRIEPSQALLSQLKNVSPLERAALYGKNGIWFDTLTSLAQLRREQPGDSTLRANWEELLRSVGLGAIATKPLLQ